MSVDKTSIEFYDLFNDPLERVNLGYEKFKYELETHQSKLYELIWNRAVSSQMTPAEFDRKSITIESEDKKIHFKANGSTIKFEGYLIYLNKDIKTEFQETSPLRIINIYVELLNISSRIILFHY